MLTINPENARYTSKESHDIVVKNLASNINTVLHSGYVDKLEIYKHFEENCKMKTELVYSSIDDIFYRSIIVDEILNGK